MWVASVVWSCCGKGHGGSSPEQGPGGLVGEQGPRLSSRLCGQEAMRWVWAGEMLAVSTA